MDAVVITPTYNECNNVEAFVTDVLRLEPKCNLLFVDDASPDGTGALLDELARSDDRIRVLHRHRKDGIGPAYLAGFAEVLGDARYREIGLVCEMDADLSHPPARLGALLAACRERVDISIGSRWVEGGATSQWSAARRLLSRGGSFYARTILGVPLRDLTAGFVCYRRAALAQILRFPIRANGYCFQIEMKARAYQLGLTIEELPIVFQDRQAGVSKMSAGIALEAIRNVWWLRRALRQGAADRPAGGAA